MSVKHLGLGLGGHERPRPPKRSHRSWAPVVNAVTRHPGSKVPPAVRKAKRRKAR
jgi:hypothetical protein